MQHQARAVVAREQVTIPTRLTHKTPPLPTLRRITALFLAQVLAATDSEKNSPAGIRRPFFAGAIRSQ